MSSYFLKNIELFLKLMYKNTNKRIKIKHKFKDFDILLCIQSEG